MPSLSKNVSYFLVTGLIGFLITVFLNTVGLRFLGQPAAVPFESRWFSTWAPAYTVWGTLLLIGIGLSLRTLVGQR